MAITCGLIPVREGIANEVFCAEPLLVGLRPGHRLAGQDTVALADLAHDVLGATSADLFPAWALSQRQALETAGISPSRVDLADTELAATRRADQRDIAWILLIPSLATAHTATVIRPAAPAQLVPFTLQWNPSRAPITSATANRRLTAQAPLVVRNERPLPDGPWCQHPRHRSGHRRMAAPSHIVIHQVRWQCQQIAQTVPEPGLTGPADGHLPPRTSEGTT